MTFQNKKDWIKVLVPQVVMTLVTLGVFFLCRICGMEDNDTVALVAICVVVTACVAAFATANFVALAAAFALVAIFPAALAAANFIALAAANFVAIFPAAFAVALVTKDYRLPKLWVVASFLVETAAISLPIFLTLN